MGGLKRFAELSEQTAHARRAQAMVAHEERVERNSLDVLHDDARALRIIEGGIVKSDDIGMLKTCHEQRFPLEALAELGIGGDMVVHDLHHHLPTEVHLLCEVDASHAAFAEQPDSLVPAQENSAHHAQWPLGSRWIIVSTTVGHENVARAKKWGMTGTVH